MSWTRHGWHALVGLALAVALAIAPLAGHLGHLLAEDALVECCCGPHALDDACGCLDCPADRSEVDAADDDHPQPAQLRRCGLTGEPPTAVSAIPLALLPARQRLAPRARPGPAPAVRMHGSERFVPVPVPPS